MPNQYIVTCTAALGPPHTWRTFMEGDLVTEADFLTPGTFAKMKRKYLRDATVEEKMKAAETTTSRDREHVHVEGMTAAEADSAVAGQKAEAKRAADTEKVKAEAQKAVAEAGKK